MIVYILIDALPASFFGLLGIWAAVVRRHWFLRFAVVCSTLALGLLIPAYEIVIQFGISIGLITAAITIANKAQRIPLRFSLEFALLAMIVIAVVSAIAGKAPEFSWQQWFGLITNSVAVSLVSLLSLWLVFGQSKLRYRITFSLLGMLVFMMLYYASASSSDLFLAPQWSQLWLDQVWERLNEPYVVAWGLSHGLPVTLTGFATLISVLLLARGSGWFTAVEGTPHIPASKLSKISRLILITIMASIFLPQCYLLYRLLTPTPYPVVEVPPDNEWIELQTTSSEEFQNSRNILQTIQLGTKTEAHEALASILPRLDRIDRSLAKSGFAKGRYEKLDPEDEQRIALRILFWQLLARHTYAERFQSTDEQIDQLLPLLRFASRYSYNVGLLWQLDKFTERHAQETVGQKLSRLSVSQCSRIASELISWDHNRGSLENRLFYQRLEDENGNWLTHFHSILREWSGEKKYKQSSERYLNCIRQTRFVIAQLALQRYFIEHERIPESLEELVPDYLPKIPLNPFTGEAVKYNSYWGGYTLTATGKEPTDTALAAGPAAPYLWYRLQEAWQNFLAWQRALKPVPR